MVVSVASGKGGTGKTLVASSLALTLGDKGKVQLLDCDVEEPNAHFFIQPVIEGVREGSLEPDLHNRRSWREKGYHSVYFS